MYIPICRAASILLRSSIVSMNFEKNMLGSSPSVIAAIWISYIPILQTLLSAVCACVRAFVKQDTEAVMKLSFCFYAAILERVSLFGVVHLEE